MDDQKAQSNSEEPNQPISNSHAASSLETQQQSTLLRLPVELRLKIYDYILIGDEICMGYNIHNTHNIYSTHTPPYENNLIIWAVPSTSDPNEIIDSNSLHLEPKPCTILTRICRQIHAESALHIFKLNEFRTSDVCVLPDLVSLLTQPQRRAIHTFRLQIYFAGDALRLAEWRFFRTYDHTHAEYRRNFKQSVLDEVPNLSVLTRPFLQRFSGVKRLIIEDCTDYGLVEEIPRGKEAGDDDGVRIEVLRCPPNDELLAELHFETLLQEAEQSIRDRRIDSNRGLLNLSSVNMD